MGKFEDLTGKKFNRLTVLCLGKEILVTNYNGNANVIVETLYLLLLLF